MSNLCTVDTAPKNLFLTSPPTFPRSIFSFVNLSCRIHRFLSYIFFSKIFFWNEFRCVHVKRSLFCYVKHKKMLQGFKHWKTLWKLKKAINDVILDKRQNMLYKYLLKPINTRLFISIVPPVSWFFDIHFTRSPMQFL